MTRRIYGTPTLRGPINYPMLHIVFVGRLFFELSARTLKTMLSRPGGRGNDASLTTDQVAFRSVGDSGVKSVSCLPFVPTHNAFNNTRLWPVLRKASAARLFYD